MQFSQKLAFLIGGCIIVLGGLCFIQYKLVHNTYELGQDAYLQDVKERLGVKTQALSDSLNHKVMAVLLQQIKGSLTKDEIPHLDNFQKQVNQLTGQYQQQINQALLSDSVLNEIAYGLQYTGIMLYHNNVADTLLSQNQQPLILTGKSPQPGATVVTVGEGIQQAGFPITVNILGTTKKSIDYRLAVYTRSVVISSQWEKAIFRRMILTLTGSIILISGTTIVFFLVFMALLRQKKIADITTDFANNMTHELKTPLSAAAIVVKSLRTPEARTDEAWYCELLGQLGRQHDKIRRMVDSVLSSAVEQPMGTPYARPFEFSALLNEMKMLAIANNRSLNTAVKEDLLFISDPDILTGILANLLDNAFKYTTPGSALHLRTEIKEDNIFISLEDEGPAIPNAYKRYLFKKFFRVPRQGHYVRGLGLGLYLCRMQAKQLSGDIHYQTNQMGGSTFTIILPYAKDPFTAGRR